MTTKLTLRSITSMKKIIPVLSVKVHGGNVVLEIPSRFIVSTLFILKNHINYQFKMLSCISGVDYPKNKRRFSVVYELLSLTFNTRLRVKVATNELYPIDSVTQVFAAAGWYESEIWDMFGVFFLKNGGLTRLLTDYGFEGYPLRKDFPLSGFVEASYDFAKKQVVNSKIELSQKYRTFKPASPWEDFKLSSN